ncbi:VOC family protein [Nocardioides dongkuii]|uniref:VOC family protein n=1 Tax=Nocardioides dongkuii TaxID=2760089 RepID=UPI0015FCE1CD|nr:VOC family protein [Nocardioides dongkuii]
MPVHLVAVTFDVPDPARTAAFWGALLGRAAVEDDGGVLMPGDATQVGLRFGGGTTDPEGPARLHLHLTSTSEDDRARTIERALALGGRHLDVGQLPEEDHVVLADPVGGAFCVIGPDNGFLAGCGRLGEVTCDGSRNVGLFWSAALGWPLVWDQDEETAIQSPHGGTKVSWGGPPYDSKRGRNRQRLELEATDPAEVARLVALGATVLTELPDTVELADPDGNEFRVRARGG